MKKQIFLSILPALLLNSACNKTENKSYEPKETPKGDIIEPFNTPNADWFVKDPTLDQVEGVSSVKAQADFALKNQRQIIVAVIDSGVEFTHEDLKNKMWNNPGETGLDQNGIDKATNGIDDDNNGYIDDVHGWNYLGNINDDTLEVTREVVRLEKKIANGETLSDAEQKHFDTVSKELTAMVDDEQNYLKQIEPDIQKSDAAKKILKEKIQLEDYAIEKLNAIQSTDSEVIQAKKDLIDICTTYRTVERLYRLQASSQNSLKYNLNKDFNPRAELGDDMDDFTDLKYGTNDVAGPDAAHGTHVAGIIAADKNNTLGIDGIAENVKIMALRAVPNGDEHDKDIALAVRYAADNGAKVINMSFRKMYSPNKAQVDEAFLYAAKKGVLLFHAAGNEGMNSDITPGFPNRVVLDSVVKNSPAEIPTWIEVGASAKTKDLKMAASFSNYGKVGVDLFAPGYQLRSTFTGNSYAVLSGTSMASPAAAGVGALLLSNFDNMTAQQAKAILLNQVRHYDGLQVHLPGSQALDLPVPFASLSSTGGVIDAYHSIKLATQLLK